MKRLYSLLLIFFLMFQCMFAFSNDNVKNKENDIRDYFVFLSIHLKLEKKSPEECIATKDCTLTSEVINSTASLNSTFVDNPMLVGSAFVILQESNKTSILTSNHVCKGIESYLDFKRLFINAKNEIFDSLKDSTKFINIDFNGIKSNYNLSSAVTLFDFYGNKYEGVKIIKQSTSKDLCIIETNNKIGKPVKISDSNCEYGEDVINISASDGNYYPSAVPFHVGAYSGTVINKSFGLMGKEEEIALYTLDIEQGSSGSAVFSKTTKNLCGNINATMKKTNLTIGITTRGIKSFIER